MEAEADYLFELSWEVCNKVGGIYSVVTSKIIPMLNFYKENYYAIGPYFPGAKMDEFKELTPPELLKDIFEKLHKIGIFCHYGRWRIEGDPNVILIDYTKYSTNINEIKGKYWEKFKIDSMNSQYHDYDEPILWSTCAGILIEEIKASLPDKKMAVQCHEWMSGGALLHIKSKNLKIGTVFTTHATILGRTLASNNIDLYEQIDKIKPEEKAYSFGIQAKHLTEKACAQNADAFTTVSEITGIEATYFLGKKPDCLVPNGLDVERFPTFDEASIKHKLFKGKIKEFLLYYFFPYYSFDIDNTLFFFLAGRYEYHDKGIDVFIKALSKLNESMKKDSPEKTVVAFIWVPTGVKEIKPDILQNKTYFEDIDDSVHDRIDEIKERLVYGIIGKKDIKEDFLLEPNVIRENEKKLARFSKDGNPPLSTHNLYNESNDEIIRGLKENNLNNTKEDRVKVVFYPVYLTGADQLIDINYYEAIMACHLGVFPSYYEPWGYTPMETGALGVASVTTDLAGFGRYIQKSSNGKKNPGIFVLERQNKSEEEIVNNLSKIFIEFQSLTKQDRIENKLRAKRLADIADWKHLIDYYIKAHNLAVQKL